MFSRLILQLMVAVRIARVGNESQKRESATSARRARACAAWLTEVLICDHHRKFHDVSQDLLRNALAGGVNADLDGGTAEEQGRAEHAHAYCFPEAPRGAYQNLLRDAVPVVLGEELCMHSRERSRLLHLEEGPRGRSNEVLCTPASAPRRHPASENRDQGARQETLTAWKRLWWNERFQPRVSSLARNLLHRSM